MSTAAESSSLTVVERVQSFVSDHKKALIVGAAVAVAAGGVVYYAASTSSRKPPPKDKKKSKSKKKKTTKDVDGPLLEEIERDQEQLDDEAFNVLISVLPTLTDEERKEKANEFKTKGNKAYTDRKFQHAVKLYTHAIQISPTPDPVFYSNRAASYMYYEKPEYEKAVEDCTAALNIDKMHVRSLNRRGTAYEKMGKLKESLKDLVAVRFISQKEDPALEQNVERVLAKLMNAMVPELLKTRLERLPPSSFVDAYFGAFRPTKKPAMPENPTTGDNTLQLALDALEARDYPHTFTLVNEAIEQGISSKEAEAIALNLRGSFKFLCGDSEGASADLKLAIAAFPSHTQSWVKIASVYMEQGASQMASDAFEEAIKLNPNDPDIYYHRGQVRFIMQQYSSAAEDYTKSVELDSSFVFGHIQLAVAQYKDGRNATAMATFRRTLKAFPQRSEPHNYYGELLLDQKRFEDAIEKFDRAIEIERQKPKPINVLPIVNKGLAIFQWKTDVKAAEQCIREALEADPECEAAIATLAQLQLQQGHFAEAADMFHKQAEIARTRPDLEMALQFALTSDAHKDFLEEYPQMNHRFPSPQMFGGVPA